ncbi:MAG: hypothetical protein IIY21_10035 [Clostridiales bacterium]|nr:hypothetical protein [Clostridiales bacterium]
MKNMTIAEGYKLNGYDATYEKATFSECTRYEDKRKIIREVTELNSGITFIYEVKKGYKKHERKSKKSG